MQLQQNAGTDEKFKECLWIRKTIVEWIRRKNGVAPIGKILVVKTESKNRYAFNDFKSGKLRFVLYKVEAQILKLGAQPKGRQKRRPPQNPIIGSAGCYD